MPKAKRMWPRMSLRACSVSVGVEGDRTFLLDCEMRLHHFTPEGRGQLALCEPKSPGAKARGLNWGGLPQVNVCCYSGPAALFAGG